jgi:hypothetical protein
VLRQHSFVTGSDAVFDGEGDPIPPHLTNETKDLLT